MVTWIWTFFKRSTCWGTFYCKKAESVEVYYLRNTCIPFVDHVITELDTKFSDLAVRASNLIGLTPAVACENTTVEIGETVELYKHFLPSPELLPHEFQRFKRLYSKSSSEQRPETCAAALRQVDARDFPNLKELLKIVCTLPITTCQCERSASALRRLHTWCRATMGQERLSSLALTHIHYDFKVDLL